MRFQVADRVPVPEHVPPELVHDFDFLDPPGASDDVQLAWKRLHDEAPDIFWTPRNGGHWIATRGEDIREIQTNHRRFSQRVMTIPASAQVFRILPANADPPEHDGYRRIIMPAFLPKAIARLEDGIRAQARELVEQIAPSGSCEFIDDFARKLPIIAFLKVVDLPLDDREMLVSLADTIMHGADRKRAEEAQAGMLAYMTRWIEERRAHPGNDLISTVVHARIGDRPLSSEEILSLVRLILFGGLDTLTSLMGFIWRFLATHPDHCSELARHPELRRNAVEELIRRHGVVNTARYITEDCVYKGVAFRSGDMIQIPNSLFGLDERITPDPLTVDFHRPHPQHVAFGNGPHTCPGALLARREIAISLDAWLDLIPEFGLAPGTRPELHSGASNNGILRLDLLWNTASV
ncbi:MAG: cytochrome P450 [Novosphingobium sp.]|nr:cytochrome P450 [Novosphingobium sp.]MCP5402250.1 cytochrome P450 [Novosphingobium sp.]